MSILDDWGVVSHWRLDEASGNAVDVHGTNHLTAVNNPVGVTGKLNTARQFASASNQYLWVASNPSLQTGDVDYWLAAWVNLSSKAANMQVASKRGSNAAREYDLFWAVASDRLVWQVGNGTTTQIGVVTASNFGAPATGTWYFVLVWHDAVNNQVGIRVNNGTANTAATTGAAGSNILPPFQVGAKNTTQVEFWDGMIDSVTFGKSPPTGIAAVIGDISSTLYASGAGRDYPFATGGPAPHYLRRSRSLSGGMLC